MVLEVSKIHLLNSYDYFELIVDNGLSKVFTPHINYFSSGSPAKLDKPMAMDVISGILVNNHKGRVQYEVIDGAGGFSIIECEGCFLPDIKVYIFIPQVFIQEVQECSRTYTLTWDGSVLILKNGDFISIGYRCQTALSVLQVFSDAMKTINSLDCATDNNKDNFLSHKNNLFSWHTHWGYLGIQHCQWLGRTVFIGNIGIKFGSTTINPPPCAACRLGKKECTTRGKYCTDNH